MAFRFGRRPVDKPVSICWLYGFLKRWQSRVVSKKPSTLDRIRVRNSTPESAYYFNNNLDKTLSELGLYDCPERIN
ncbi:hypothetical protein DPMN_037736 [Dreissena polymorpha]|uniref:Uncharacterized protein n=1 Tax=Dreissena polymorpha TaxID=45954 RepID=A0A9D4MDY8_DREPO|nr:hypothetical protein DPMN_037736 [Dreissena polymorpha]